MTWTYQMNSETIKETNAALKKIKDSPIHKSRRIKFLRVLCVTLLTCILFTVFSKGKFDPGYMLIIFVIAFPLVLLSTRSQSRTVLSRQLPARHCITVENGRLMEELTLRDGTVSSGEKSLSEILQAEPFCGGLLIRFTGPAFLFLPKAAFRQISPQESAAFIRDAIAASAAALPDTAERLPKQAGEAPPYGTLYFDLPASHIYRLYMKCVLHLYRNPLRFVRSAFGRGVKPLILPAILLLIGAMLYPEILLMALLIFILLFAFLYALNLLLVVWRFYLAEKKNTLAAQCGPQHISLYEDHLTLGRAENTYQFYYQAFYNVYETKEAFYLLQKNPLSVILIPRWAFGSPQEETLFIKTLREKITGTNKHRRL